MDPGDEEGLPEGGDSHTEGRVPLRAGEQTHSGGWRLLDGVCCWRRSEEEALRGETESQGEPEKVDESGVMCCQVEAHLAADLICDWEGRVESRMMPRLQNSADGELEHPSA